MRQILLGSAMCLSLLGCGGAPVEPDGQPVAPAIAAAASPPAQTKPAASVSGDIKCVYMQGLSSSGCGPEPSVIENPSAQ
jgi:hypothetical protein